MVGASPGGRTVVRSSKAVLGAAFIARGLAGDPSRDAATGRRKSPGLFGSIFLLLFGAVFLGVGIYVHEHSAALRAQPGTKGSPAVMGWICIAVGALIVGLAGLTLISRIAALVIGLALLVAAMFERSAGKTAVPGAPVDGGAGPGYTPVVAPAGGDADPGRLLPPPLDPRLPAPRA